MPPENDILTQIVLLDAKIDNLTEIIMKSSDDHEARLRKLETDTIPPIQSAIARIEERQTTLSVFQTAFTTAASVVASVVAIFIGRTK
jgi:hypothetical protein